MSMMFPKAIAVVIFLVILSAGWVSAQAVVKIDSGHGGSWTGLDDGKIVSFYGIRYAHSVRWAPPEKAVQSTAHFALTWPPVCAQADGSGQDDCNFLNVFIPSNRSHDSPMPVLVHIHGGGFVRGSGNDDSFPHREFASRGFAVVTINYRLGIFGFMAIPELATLYPKTPTNFGLLDQRMALEWVHENIFRFDGDNGLVTLVGESAGAASIIHQLVYQNGQAKQLFHQGIVASSPALGGPSFEVPNIYTSYYQTINEVGCHRNHSDPNPSLESSASLLECLRKVPIPLLPAKLWRDEVFPFTNAAPASDHRPGWPCTDHVNFPDVQLALASGKFLKNVRIIIGGDLDEGSVFAPIIAPIISPTVELLHSQFQDVFEDQAENVWSWYKPAPQAKNAYNSLQDIVGDTLLMCPTYISGISLVNNIPAVWKYGNAWTYKHLNWFWKKMGPTHTSATALLYNWPSGDTIFPPTFSPDEKAAAIQLFNSLVSFIKGGVPDPNLWPQYAAPAFPELHFNDSHGNLSLLVGNNWKKYPCEYWKATYPPLGLWKNLYSGPSIWRNEPFFAHMLNGAVWGFIHYPRLLTGIILSVLVIILIAIIKYCLSKR